MSDDTETTNPQRLTAEELMRASRLAEHHRADRFTLGSPEQNAYGIQLLEHSDGEVVRAALALIPHFTTPTPKGEAWMKRLHDSKSEESIEDSSETEIELEVSTPVVVIDVVPEPTPELSEKARADLKLLAEGIRQQSEVRQAKIDEINFILKPNEKTDYTQMFRSKMDRIQNGRIQVFIKNIENLEDGPLDRLLKDLRILEKQRQAEREAKKVAREAEAADRRKAKAAEAKAEPPKTPVSAKKYPPIGKPNPQGTPGHPIQRGQTVAGAGKSQKERNRKK